VACCPSGSLSWIGVTSANCRGELSSSAPSRDLSSTSVLNAWFPMSCRGGSTCVPRSADACTGRVASCRARTAASMGRVASCRARTAASMGRVASCRARTAASMGRVASCRVRTAVSMGCVASCRVWGAGCIWRVGATRLPWRSGEA
jgi:hypothetical protein